MNEWFYLGPIALAVGIPFLILGMLDNDLSGCTGVLFFFFGLVWMLAFLSSGAVLFSQFLLALLLAGLAGIFIFILFLMSLASS